MKLQQSLPLLAQTHAVMFRDTMVIVNWVGRTGLVMREYDAKGKQRADLQRRLRWDLWWSVPKARRDDIIAASVPRDKWVGGYPDIKDDHIDTMLRHVWGGFVNQCIDQAEGQA